jgi:hypothetical protein
VRVGGKDARVESNGGRISVLGFAVFLGGATESWFGEAFDVSERDFVKVFCLACGFMVAAEGLGSFQFGSRRWSSLKKLGDGWAGW